MITLVLVLGLALAVAGGTVTGVLIGESRGAITRAASRRLHGAGEAPAWLGHVAEYLGAAAAATALGAVLLGSALPALLGGLGVTAFALVAVLLGLPAILAVAYLAPRWLARIRGIRSVPTVLPFIRPWSALLAPVLPSAAETDPDLLLRSIASGGSTVDPELVMAGGVMMFSERPVREVMTPRTEVVAVPEGASRGEIAEAFAQGGYSRVPVYRGTLDEVVGIVHAFDLLTVGEEVPLPVLPVTFTPGIRHCGELLLEMQRERRHLAVVLDEFGGTLGIVTLEDLLEVLVGEIYDELDGPVGTPAVGAARPAPIEVDATTSIAEVAGRFGVSFPATAATTVAGLLADLARRIPETGERFILSGLEFDVLQASPARAEQIIVRVAGHSTSLDPETL
ncbi:MAG TPA: hemolysin family protein [Gemmatimonadales bacterium]|nr:hemolysin family protein [Gemmatimonadales bacterium]